MMGKLTIDRSLFELSDYVFYLDSNEYFLTANEPLLAITGLKSESDLIGKSAWDMPWRDGYQVYAMNNSLVRKNKNTLCFVEPLPNFNNKNRHVFSVKSPIVSSKDEIIGVKGVSIPLQDTPFNALMNKLMLAADKLNFSFNPQLMLRIFAQVSKLEQLESQWSKEAKLFDYGSVAFSLREAQCLHYFLNNYSAEETAKLLFISKKTVEFHLANIKLKLDCNKKSQISRKAINDGFIDLMFMTF
jgi:DNA-binding CsgD family transcriptional regulator